MAVTINGTTGIAGVDGSASTPAVQGTDTNTGIFFPAADTIAFGEGGAEAMRIDSSGNVGIGTTSPNNRLTVAAGSTWYSGTFAGSGGTDRVVIGNLSGLTTVGGHSSALDAWKDFAISGTTLRFQTDGSEKARITNDGILRVGMQNYAAQPSSTNYGVAINNTNTGSRFYGQGTGTETQIEFGNTNGARGSIQTNSTNTLYNTTSDYRLKENVVPMVNALATVSALKPCTYTWKVDGSAGQGFIAHELAEVVPDCVTGEKDAVDEDGNIKPQFVDTSFLVATLTAAIQELKAITDAQATRIETLEAQNAAFEARLAALEAK